MMRNDVRRAFKVEPCTVYLYIFFILYLIFHICGKTNKSKKSPNDIYSLVLISLECISLVLLELPCYHHETEVILLNVNTSIHTSIIDILFLKLFCDPVFVFMREVYKGHSQHWQGII